MRLLTLVAALFVTGVLAGCDLSSSLRPAPRQIVVHAVLDLGSQDQLVFVEWAHTGSATTGTGSFNATAGISGAQVTITAPDGEVMTAENVFDPGSNLTGGRYRLSLVRYAASLVPGGTYSLRVRIPSGEEITGTTTIPSIAAVPPLAPEFFRVNDTLRITLPSAPGVAAFEVRIQLRESERFQGPEEIRPYVVFAHSAINLPGTVNDLYGNPVLIPGFVSDLSVSAVDANFYDYYRTLPDPFTPALPSKLHGAIGVFGSVVPVMVRVLNVTR